MKSSICLCLNVEGTSWYQQKVTKQNKRPVGQGPVERRTRNRDGKAIRDGGFEKQTGVQKLSKNKVNQFFKIGHSGEK